MPEVRYSESFLTSWLCDRLRRHNRQVLAFAALSAAGTALAWGVLYAVAHWLTLLTAAIIRGPYATVPAGFPLGFAAIAATLIFSAWVDRKLTPNDLPPDEKSPREVAMDFLLAIPRMTLAITGNLSAWLTLSHTDISAAVVLVSRVSREQRIPLNETPLEIPEGHTRERVLGALLLLGVIEFQRDQEEIWLRLPPAAKKALGGAALE